MLRKYLQQILSLNNFIDGLVITDKFGNIVYYHTFRPEINNIREEEVIGKNILEVYPELTKETSMIMKTLSSGEAFYNQFEEVLSFKGEKRTLIETVLPIIENNEIIGAIDITKYVINGKAKGNIVLNINNEFINTDDLYSDDDIIGNSYHILLIKDKIYKVSVTDTPVIIYGETGTGKELIAQAIHSTGNRKEYPFVALNCANIPDDLIESILFGTTKGSFTGAVDKKGLFELAQNGTIFLDEINSMGLQIQPKLLRALEEKKIRRIGGEAEIKLNVRVIAAMNINPIEAVKRNEIREDLYYRLAVASIKTPPLRSRKEDIQVLVAKFIDIYNLRMDKRITNLSKVVEDLFYEYSWPGNVRELKNVIEGAFNSASGGTINLNDLPDLFFETICNYNGNEILEEIETDSCLKQRINKIELRIIQDTIDKSRNKAEAAEKLGISRQLLNYKLSKLK